VKLVLVMNIMKMKISMKLMKIQWLINEEANISKCISNVKWIKWNY